MIWAPRSPEIAAILVTLSVTLKRKYSGWWPLYFFRLRRTKFTVLSKNTTYAKSLSWPCLTQFLARLAFSSWPADGYKVDLFLTSALTLRSWGWLPLSSSHTAGALGHCQIWIIPRALGRFAWASPRLWIAWAPPSLWLVPPAFGGLQGNIYLHKIKTVPPQVKTNPKLKFSNLHYTTYYTWQFQ